MDRPAGQKKKLFLQTEEKNTPEEEHEFNVLLNDLYLFGDSLENSFPKPESQDVKKANMAHIQEKQNKERASTAHLDSTSISQKNGIKAEMAQGNKIKARMAQVTPARMAHAFPENDRIYASLAHLPEDTDSDRAFSIDWDLILEKILNPGYINDNTKYASAQVLAIAIIKEAKKHVEKTGITEVTVNRSTIIQKYPTIKSRTVSRAIHLMDEILGEGAVTSVKGSGIRVKIDQAYFFGTDKWIDTNYIKRTIYPYKEKRLRGYQIALLVTSFIIHTAGLRFEDISQSYFNTYILKDSDEIESTVLPVWFYCRDIFEKNYGNAAKNQKKAVFPDRPWAYLNKSYSTARENFRQRNVEEAKEHVKLMNIVLNLHLYKSSIKDIDRIAKTLGIVTPPIENDESRLRTSSIIYEKATDIMTYLAESVLPRLWNHSSTENIGGYLLKK